MVVRAPGRGPGSWAGAPSAQQDSDGGWVVAYRVRTPATRGGFVVVARGTDGEHLEPIATLGRDRFGAESLERPALVRLRDGRWRLYVSCATPGTKHWRIDALDAADPTGLAGASPRTVLPGDGSIGVKDPVVRQDARRLAGLGVLPSAGPSGRGGPHAHRLATSEDGLRWTWRGTVLTGTAGAWDARGARVTAVLADGRAAYDGRATAEENFAERTGLAVPAAGRAGAWSRTPTLRSPTSATSTWCPRGRRSPPLLRGPAARRQPRAAHDAGRAVTIRRAQLAAGIAGRSARPARGCDGVSRRCDSRAATASAIAC